MRLMTGNSFSRTMLIFGLFSLAYLCKINFWHCKPVWNHSSFTIYITGTCMSRHVPNLNGWNKWLCKLTRNTAELSLEKIDPFPAEEMWNESDMLYCNHIYCTVNQIYCAVIRYTVLESDTLYWNQIHCTVNQIYCTVIRYTVLLMAVCIQCIILFRLISVECIASLLL